MGAALASRRAAWCCRRLACFCRWCVVILVKVKGEKVSMSSESIILATCCSPVAGLCVADGLQHNTQRTLIHCK